MPRQKKEINWDIVERMLEAGCTATQIAGKFRINHDTFYRRFQEEYDVRFNDFAYSMQEAGEADLVLMQHMKALNNKAAGNIQMLTWLGKVRLGQREADTINDKAPNQDMLTYTHRIMELEHRLAAYEENVKASPDNNKPQAE